MPPVSSPVLLNTRETWWYQREFHKKPRWWRMWSISHMRRHWESWNCSNRRRECSRWDLTKVFKYLKGGCKEDRTRPFPVVPNDRSRANGHKVKLGRFPPNSRKQFSLWQWPSPGTGCPVRLWSLHPWRYSKTWTWSQAASCRQTCLIWGVGPDGLQRSLPTSIILLFLSLNEC